MCNDMAVLLSNGSVAIYKSPVENGVKEKFKPPGKAPTLVAAYRYYNLECAIETSVLKVTVKSNVWLNKYTWTSIYSGHPGVSD